MKNRRRFLQVAISALLLANSCAWAAPGDWQYTLGTPFDIKPNEVDVRSAQFNGRACVAVELSTKVQEVALGGAGGNGATVAIVEKDFNNGIIEVDVAGAINGKGSPDSRAFAGLAFHVAGSAKAFEAVYLRMSNGSKNVPPPPAPRDVRAVQYVAHPDFHFDVSRKQFPGKYEKAAPVALDMWHRLRIEIAGSRMRVSVDGAEILDVDDLRLANRGGSIGLFVDDGTTGYFSNLRILPK